MKILFASNNKGKFDELVDDFKKVGLTLEMPKTHLELPEPSEMLAQNAEIKARAAMNLCPDFDYALR